MLRFPYLFGSGLALRTCLRGLFTLAALAVPATGLTVPVWEADFESATGNNAWTRTGSVTTDGSGRWGRGNPNATDYQLGSAFEGANYYVTGVTNPSGNEGSGDLDGGNTILTSAAVAIPASASLSFAWYIGHDNRNSPANEFLTVSIVTGADLAPAVGGTGVRYLQITSGAREGERFDVLTGGVDAVTLRFDPDIFSQSDGVETFDTSDGLPADTDLFGASYEIIRYRTVDEVFDKLTTFEGEEDTDPSDATRLLFHNNRRSNPGFEILMLFGTSTANSKWILTNDLVFQTDQGGRRLDPCGGLWVHPKNSGNSGAPTIPAPVEVMTFGLVADHDQACALNDDYQVIGAMWPLDQSLAGGNGLDLTVVADFDGGIDPGLSTEILFWTGDLVVDDPLVTTYSEGYRNYMLLDGGGMQNWIDINDLGLSDLDALLILQSHRAALLKLLPGDRKEPHIYPQPNF